MTLDEIRKLIEAATPGPWKVDTHMTDDGCYEFAHGPWHDQSKGDTDEAERDARFIAAARTLLPAMMHIISIHDLGEELEKLLG